MTINATTIKLGGRDYTLAPMNIRTMSKHQEFISKMIAPDFNVIDHFKEFCGLAMDALKRTHEDITMEVIEDGLDMGNIPVFLAALFQVSGFEPKAGEVKPGERSPS